MILRLKNSSLDFKFHIWFVYHFTHMLFVSAGSKIFMNKYIILNTSFLKHIMPGTEFAFLDYVHISIQIYIYIDI